MSGEIRLGNKLLKTAATFAPPLAVGDAGPFAKADMVLFLVTLVLLISYGALAKSGSSSGLVLFGLTRHLAMSTDSNIYIGPNNNE